MLLGDSVEGGKHQRQDDLAVLLYQAEDVLIIPEIKSPLCYLRHKQAQESMKEVPSQTGFCINQSVCGDFHLEVRAGDAGCDLLEERLLDPDELGRLDHVQDLLDLAEKHYLNAKTHDSSAQNNKGKTKQKKNALRDVGVAHLFLRARFGPIFEQPSDDLQREEQKPQK